VRHSRTKVRTSPSRSGAVTAAAMAACRVVTRNA